MDLHWIEVNVFCCCSKLCFIFGRSNLYFILCRCSTTWRLLFKNEKESYATTFIFQFTKWTFIDSVFLVDYLECDIRYTNITVLHLLLTKELGHILGVTTNTHMYTYFYRKIIRNKKKSETKMKTISMIKSNINQATFTVLVCAYKVVYTQNRTCVWVARNLNDKFEM